ncbi:MAG: hypothetical protein E7033_06980 [Akkermansiaceae bacterium]|nr:hypothetical protein [Akkermansiaceae bacterium]
MSVNNYKRDFCEAVLRLLWQQWCALGVAGYAEGQHARRVLDPEALMLFSAAFCRYEPRLYDQMACWMMKYSRLLNPVRLKALAESAAYKDLRSLAYLAALCVEAGDIRWKRAAEVGRHTAWAEEEREALFRSPEDASALFSRGEDATALQYGFLRSQFAPRNKIRQKPDLTPSTLLLRIRSMMGVTARAEVVLLLLESPCNIQQLSERSGFGRSAVKAVLDELVLGNLVCKVQKKEGKSSIYTLSDGGVCRSLAGGSAVRLPRWSAVYDSLGKIWQLISQPLMEKVSADTFRGELCRLFRENLRPALLYCGIPELETLTETSIWKLPNIMEQI